jgi:hypothetical protein
VSDLDEFEDGLIEEFRQHPVLKNLDSIPAGDFAAILLQRRFLSLSFTPAYDLAIDLLEDEKGRKIARVILREEYPGSDGYTRSHREDMKEDLLALGIPRRDLVATRPTPATVQAIADTLDLISDAGAGDCADAQLLTILRFWGEVLVSVEYGELWRRMAGHLMSDGENRSVFYYPHHYHDAKVRPLSTASPLATTHSDQLGLRLWQLLDSDRAKRLFRATERNILLLKTRFYDQFTPMLKNVGMEASARP